MVYFVRIIYSASNYMYIYAHTVGKRRCSAKTNEQNHPNITISRKKELITVLVTMTTNTIYLGANASKSDASIILAAFSDNDNKKSTLILSLWMISVDSVCIL